MGEIVSNSASSNEGQKIPTPPSKGRKSLDKRKMTTIIAISAMVLVGIVTIILVFKYSVLHRHSNNMNAKFRVESISVSPVELSPSSQISASWDIQFAVQNPSSKSVLYQRVDMWISYEQERLASATIAPFRILDNNWTPMDGRLIATLVEVNEQAVKDMGAEMANGSVNFNIGLGAGYWVGDSEENWVWWAVEAWCNDVRVGFLSKDMVGILVGGPVECSISKAL